MKPVQLVMLLLVGMGIGFLCGAAVTIAHGSVPKFESDQVVAQVGDATLTRGELAQRMLAESGTSFLDKEIRDKLIVENAARHAGVTVSADELDQRIKESIDFAATQLAKNRYLEMPHWMLEEELRPMIMLEKLLHVTVSPAEVKYFYQHNVSMFTSLPCADMIEVATYDENDAKRARQRILHGENPLVVAQQLTTDDDVKAHGFATDWRNRDNMSPSVVSAVFYGDHGNPLRAKHCTEVIEQYTGLKTPESPEGKLEYFVFYIKDIQPARTAPLNMVLDGVTFYARAQKLNNLAIPWFHAHAHDAAWQRMNNVGAMDSTLVTVPISLDDYPLPTREQ